MMHDNIFHNDDIDKDDDDDGNDTHQLWGKLVNALKSDHGDHITSCFNYAALYWTFLNWPWWPSYIML